MTVWQQIANLNWFDYATIVVILFSTLISLVRGFVKELISLVTWVVGFWLAFRFSGFLAKVLTDYISSQPIRVIVSFVAIFIVILIFGAIANFLISLILVKTGLSGTDRIIGMIFGFARGVLLIGVIILLLATTAFIKETWWQKSILIPHFQVIVDWLHGVLPQKFQELSALIPK